MLFLNNFGITVPQLQELIGNALQRHVDTRIGIPGYASWSVAESAGPLRVECHIRPANLQGFGMFCERLSGKGFSLTRYGSMGEQKIMGVHMHAEGDAVWQGYASGLAPEPDVDGDGLTDEACLFCVLTNREESRHVTVAISDADILPSFVKGRPIELQVAAFPTDIHYYPTVEEALESHTMTTGEGIRMHWVEGIPIGLIGLTQTVMLAARVKEVEPVSVDELGGFQFLRIRVDTDFGPLDIIHTEEMVDEEERPHIRAGAGLFMEAIISGNPARGPYREGMRVTDGEAWSRLISDAVIFRRPRRTGHIWAMRRYTHCLGRSLPRSMFDQFKVREWMDADQVTVEVISFTWNRRKEERYRRKKESPLTYVPWRLVDALRGTRSGDTAQAFGVRVWTKDTKPMILLVSQIDHARATFLLADEWSIDAFDGAIEVLDRQSRTGEE